MNIEVTEEQIARINEALTEEGADSIHLKKEIQKFIDKLVANYLGDL